MPRLRVVQGARAGETIVLPVWAVVLGRDEASDVLVDDQRASRQHACIRLQHESWAIRDLESANGTFLDGERVRDWTPLRDRAEVRIGRTVLRFEDDEPAAADAAAPSVAAPDSRGGAPGTAPASRGAAPAPAAQPALPRFPGFETLEVAGRGATGTVYRARQLSLGRIVAVKRLSSRFSSQPEAVERFDREARAAAALSHPHVVQIFDVAHDGGRHWFTMEFMEGGTVEDRLLAAPGAKLPWREAVRIVADAAEGLAHLHAAGLVHRDIKPANLFLDARGQVKLGDLGTLVRADEAVGERIGTPHYMSPEQANREPVTRASDVYSLGATLYRMLAGTSPHHGKDVREIVERVATETPVPVERHCPVLPPAVGLLVRQMMARDPAARPADAAELSRRLAATLESVEDAKRSRRRVRSAKASATGWVLGLALAGGAAWAFVHRDDLKAQLFPERTSGGDGARRTAGVGGDGRGAQPEDARAVAARVAAETYEEIRRREDALGAPSAANADARRSVADDYARMAEVFPLTSEAVVRAHWRARALRDEVARLTGGDASNAAFADRWVDRALQDQPSAAARSPAGEAPPSFVPPEDLPGDEPGSGGAGTGGIGGAAGRTPPPGASAEAVRASREALLVRADALAARRQVAEAMELVLAWMREQRLAANARQAPSEVHEEIAKCKVWMRRTARTASARLESDLASDRALCRTQIPATALVDPDGATAAGGATPFRSPAEALRTVRALEPLLVTGPGRSLARRRAVQLEAIASAWPDGPGDVDATLADALRSSKDRPEAVAAALWLAVEAGRADAAARLLEAARGLPEGDRAAARAEIAALRARPPAADVAGRDAWRRAHAGTMSALLAAGGGGAPAPVFALDETDRWFESWGAAPK